MIERSKMKRLFAFTRIAHRTQRTRDRVGSGIRKNSGREPMDFSRSRLRASAQCVFTIGAAVWTGLLADDASRAMGFANEPPGHDRAPAGGWRLADLEPTMKSLQGRSYENGRRLFARAHCTKCHRFNDAGVEFGPNLARLDLQFKPLDILRDILDPARRIADAKYDLWVFQTDAGRVVTGLIVKRTEQTLEVREKPPGEAPPVVLERSEIEERFMSLGSIMPRGLLDELTRDEIADLVAYVAARGDPTDPLVRMPAGGEPPPSPRAAAKPALKPAAKRSGGATCRSDFSPRGAVRYQRKRSRCGWRPDGAAGFRPRRDR